MKLLCKPRDILSKIENLKEYRISYVYQKFNLEDKFKLYHQVSEAVREEFHLELLHLTHVQHEIDLSEFKIEPNKFYEFIDKIRVAKEYNAEIYIDTFDEVIMLDFINKKLKYYEDEHKNEQTGIIG